MLHHGNRGKRAGQREVRKFGFICLTLVDGYVCRNIPLESAKTQWSYGFCGTGDTNTGDSET